MHRTAVMSLGTLAMVMKEDVVISAFAHYLSWDHLPGQSSNKRATQLSLSAIVLLLWALYVFSLYMEISVFCY
jgi:hypothetical protein